MSHILGFFLCIELDSQQGQGIVSLEMVINSVILSSVFLLKKIISESKIVRSIQVR